MGRKMYAADLQLTSKKSETRPPGIPFAKTQNPPAKEKKSRSVKYIILHHPVPKSPTFIGSIYNNMHA